jgi:hypothetical protein
LQHAAVAVELVDPEVGLDGDEAIFSDAQVAFDGEVAELLVAGAQGDAASPSCCCQALCSSTV